MRGRPKQNDAPPSYPIVQEDEDGKYLIYPNKVEFIAKPAFFKKFREDDGKMKDPVHKKIKPKKTATAPKTTKEINPGESGFEEYNNSLPKSARKYFNPKTDKWISYVGAKLSGII